MKLIILVIIIPILCLVLANSKKIGIKVKNILQVVAGLCWLIYLLPLAIGIALKLIILIVLLVIIYCILKNCKKN